MRHIEHDPCDYGSRRRRQNLEASRPVGFANPLLDLLAVILNPNCAQCLGAAIAKAMLRN